VTSDRRTMKVVATESTSVVFKARIFADVAPADRPNQYEGGVTLSRGMRARIGEKEVFECRRARALNALTRASTSTRCSSTGMPARKGAHVRSQPRFAEATRPAHRGNMLRGTNTYAGGAHVSCRRCRNRSTTSRDRKLRLWSGNANTGPKRVTAPGEATSDVGSRWQNREIDVTEDLRKKEFSGGDSRSRGTSGCTSLERVGCVSHDRWKTSRVMTRRVSFTRARQRVTSAKLETFARAKATERRRGGDRGVRSGLEETSHSCVVAVSLVAPGRIRRRRKASSRGSVWCVVKRASRQCARGSSMRSDNRTNVGTSR
jgi:hypothetical protein